LVYLEDGTGENVMTNGWCRGYCERTREHGDFPSECVYVLPTLDKPQRDVLVGADLNNSRTLNLKYFFQ